MPLREVRLSPDYDVSDYEEFQSNYLFVVDRGDRWPLRSTKVYIGDQLVIQTNSLGCFGPEPDPSKPNIGIFGDSVVQGTSSGSFVSHIDMPDFNIINGGMEGAALEHIIGHVFRVHARSPLAAVAVHPGFHNLTYNETGFLHWETQLRRLQELGVPVALFRLTADIHPEVVERGYGPLHRQGHYDLTPHSKDDDAICKLQDALIRKNKLIERVSDWSGYTLIDLDPLLAPKTADEVTERFFDIIHPRPELYPEMGAAVAAQLKPLIGAVALAPSQPNMVPALTTQEALQNRGRNYPLW
jgi:hypothetical protein